MIRFARRSGNAIERIDQSTRTQQDSGRTSIEKTKTLEAKKTNTSSLLRVSSSKQRSNAMMIRKHLRLPENHQPFDQKGIGASPDDKEQQLLVRGDPGKLANHAAWRVCCYQTRPLACTVTGQPGRRSLPGQPACRRLQAGPAQACRLQVHATRRASSPT